MVIKNTPTSTNTMPMIVVKWKTSLNSITENNATVAIAPEVKIGCATFKGNRAKAAAYKRNAQPYNPNPNQKGQFNREFHESEKEGNFLGGIIATLIKTLASAFTKIPNKSISHFIFYSFRCNNLKRF